MTTTRDIFANSIMLQKVATLRHGHFILMSIPKRQKKNGMSFVLNDLIKMSLQKRSKSLSPLIVKWGKN